MRILHIVSNISVRSGVMSVLMNYYRNMDIKNFSFDFLYFDDREVTFKEEIEKLGGHVYKIERSNNPFKLLSKIREFVNENILNYKIIHLHENYLIGSLIGLKKNNHSIKIISQAHATKFSDNKINEIRNKICSIPNYIIPDFYLACSKAAGKEIFGKKFKNRGRVLNNAIDIKKFCINDSFRKQKRQELNVENNYVIGHVGNFNAQKNHKFLIDVFYEVQKEKEEARLVLVGCGEEQDSIIKKCEELQISDKVIFLGVRTDVNEIMNAFDCFVLPSIYEGLGIVLVEAQSTGVPCVFSDVVPEEANILKDNNVTVSLKESAKKWSDLILKLKKNIGINVEEQIRQAGYDIKEESKKLEEYYYNIIKNEV